MEDLSTRLQSSKRLPRFPSLQGALDALQAGYREFMGQRRNDDDPGDREFGSPFAGLRGNVTTPDGECSTKLG
jgi:hypothetical protein